MLSLAVACGAPAVRAAQIYTETFPANFSGWQAADTYGYGEWSWIGGQLDLFSYPYTEFFPPIQDTATLTATNTSSSGRFVGNWATSGVDAIGFDFVASNFPPTGLEISLTKTGSTVFVRALPVPPVGALESFYIPADSIAAGDWVGIGDISEASFAAARSNITSVRLKTFYVATASGGHFRVDNAFLTRSYRWDGGTGGDGATWLNATNWAPDGLAGANARVIFTNAGSATVIGIDSSQATGGVLQVGQMLCVVSNRTFENPATTNDSTLQFNGYGGLFVKAGTNTVTFRNGATRKLNLVGNRYRGEFDVEAGGAIVISNCVISQASNVTCRVDKLGQGWMFLGASNTFGGGAQVKAGVLTLGHTNALGSGGFIAQGGRLDLNGFSIGVSSLSGTTGVISDASATAGTTTVTVTQSSNTTFAGIFSNGASRVVQLVKAGTGTLYIAGTNVNTGPTTVNAGRLYLAASHATGTNAFSFGRLGAGVVVVSNGATFGGFGRAGGPVVNHGTVVPGYPTGVLYCASSYTQATNAVIVFNIGGTTGATDHAQSWTEAVITTNSATNVVTNVVTVSRLYNRMLVAGAADLAGTLRTTFATNLALTNGLAFNLVSALSLSGTFATNTFATNNLPALAPGLEWQLHYAGGEVILACVTSSPPVVHVANASVVEGDAGQTAMQFMISLSKPATADVTVVFATSNGTAVAGDDYVATNGTAVIPSGGIAVYVTVPVNGDPSFEYDETLHLDLVSATNASIATDNAIGTVFNDDAAPTLGIGDATLAEGESGQTLFQFPVTLSAAIGAPVYVTYATSNGAAIAGEDYAATNATVLIAPGNATGFVTVAVFGDPTREGDEAFTVHLLAVTNATATNAWATGTILNDDPLPTVDIAGVVQNEYNGPFINFVFIVSMSTQCTSPVTVDFTASNGTALAGSDYIATNGVVTLPVGSVATTIVVRVLGDTTQEANEEFSVILSNPSTNAALGTAIATGLILDDDAPLYAGYFAYSLQIPDVDQRGFDDDPDGDGYVNLLEFVTGGDPTNVDAVAAMDIGRTNGFVALRFSRNTNSADQMTLVVEHADVMADGAAWNGIATNVFGQWSGPATVGESGDDSPVAVSVQDPGPSTNRILRLRVIAPDQ